MTLRQYYIIRWNILSFDMIKEDKKMTYDALGTRMKKYEYVTRTHLINRCPAIIRIDGKAFHTFTRGF